jgi:hypothetical protein
MKDKQVFKSKYGNIVGLNINADVNVVLLSQISMYPMYLLM